MAPGDAASHARFSNRNNCSSSNSSSISARARIVVRICVRFQLELELWLEFVSKFGKIARKWLLELASIAKVSKTIRKNGKGWEFVSNWCPSLSWWQFEIEKLLENGCLSWLPLQKFRKQFEIELASIAKVSKTIRKNARADIKTQCPWSDTPLGRSPANF